MLFGLSRQSLYYWWKRQNRFSLLQDRTIAKCDGSITCWKLNHRIMKKYTCILISIFLCPYFFIIRASAYYRHTASKLNGRWNTRALTSCILIVVSVIQDPDLWATPNFLPFWVSKISPNCMTLSALLMNRWKLSVYQPTISSQWSTQPFPLWERRGW